tara:strand:- start:442 stop:2013 length:1572 start_codon:yes stop_codon:yes gene_type:complete
MEGKTIFDLPTSIDQLPGINDPMSRMAYQQVSSTRDVTSASFPNGQIHFKFETSGTRRWIPSKSYIRMRCKFTDATGTGTLAEADQIGPNMGLCANLFQSAEFRIADKTVSRISDYMPQVDALQTRMDMSKGWLDSVGEASNFWQSNVHERIAEVSSDGKQVKDEWVATKRLDLGFSAGTTVEIAVTGVLEFKVGTLPATAGIFSAGDEIEIDFAGGTLRHRISATPGAATLQLNNLTHIASAAAAVEFRRYRRKSSRRVREFELTWSPPLSLLRCQEALPSMKAELILSPQTASAYKLRAAEALTAGKTAGTGNNYDFSVETMYFYVATVESDRVDDLTYYLNLDETRCQVESNLSTTLSQKNFSVSPSTYALTCAFQDDEAGSDPLYSSSKFKIRGEGEKGLTRLFLTYDGASKPSPDSDNQFVAASNRDLTTQRYADSLLQSGQYFREGGCETLEDWQARGMYYHLAWPKDGRSRSTRAQVNAQLAVATNARVLLFDHYKSVAHISVKDGRVVDVNLLEG